MGSSPAHARGGRLCGASAQLLLQAGDLFGERARVVHHHRARQLLHARKSVPTEHEGWSATSSTRCCSPAASVSAAELHSTTSSSAGCHINHLHAHGVAHTGGVHVDELLLIPLDRGGRGAVERDDHIASQHITARPAFTTTRAVIVTPNQAEPERAVSPARGSSVISSTAPCSTSTSGTAVSVAGSAEGAAAAGPLVQAPAASAMEVRCGERTSTIHDFFLCLGEFFCRACKTENRVPCGGVVEAARRRRCV